MDRVTDLQINCAVRRVLVHHWIDLGRLSVRTAKGVVSLTGRLQRLQHSQEELNAARFLVIATDIKRITHVRRVNMSFENWTCGSGVWTPVAPRPATAAPQQLRDPVLPEVFDLTEVEKEESSAGTG